MFYSDPSFSGGGCEAETPLLRRTGEECLPRTAGWAPRPDLHNAMAITLPEERKHPCPQEAHPILGCPPLLSNHGWTPSQEMALNNPCPFFKGYQGPESLSIPQMTASDPPTAPWESEPGCLRRAPPPLKLPFNGHPASLRANKWTDKQIQPCG